MCTIFTLRAAVPGWDLVMAANRDEMLARSWSPPSAIGELGTSVRIWAPTDGYAGGTWIGVNSAGLIVAITNRFLEDYDPARRSRGILCREVLACSDLDAASELVSAAVAQDRYNGFNLVLASVSDVAFLSYGQAKLDTFAAQDAVHVVTSTHDRDPALLTGLRQRMADCAKESPDLAGFVDGARLILADRTPYDDGYSVCKHRESYGTRSAAIIGLRREHPPQMYFAHGRPCENAFEPVDLA